jgi:hypothetical protein
LSHDDDLDFERADFTHEALSREQHDGTRALGSIGCSICRLEIADRYFTKNQAFICASCEGPERLAGPPGSALARALGAIAAGSLAAALASAVWMAVTLLTGYEIGLIAIAVGWAVGIAVSIGNRGVGGLPYQLLATFLTYTAIVMTYVPMLAHELQTNPFEAAVNQPDYTRLNPDLGGNLDETGQEIHDFDASASVAQDEGNIDEGTVEGIAESGDGKIDAFLAWVIAIPIAYTVPFLSGFDNVIGLLIIGFGLYQAWNMTGKREIHWAGPFRIGRDPSA